MNSEAIKTVFSAFDFFSNLSTQQTDFLEFVSNYLKIQNNEKTFQVERFKEDQNNVSTTEGVTREQAKYYFEVG